MMDGEIDVNSCDDPDSAEGTWTEFTVILKNISLTSIKDDYDNDLQEPDIIFKEAAILIVDDIEYNISLVKGFLEEHNFKIYTAVDGKEALEATAKHHPDYTYGFENAAYGRI